MTQPKPRFRIRASYRVYGFLLRAYPAAFRRAHGREMAVVFRDSCKDADRQGGLWGMVGCWVRALLDLAANVPMERLAQIRSALTTGRRGWAYLLLSSGLGVLAGWVDIHNQDVQPAVACIVAATFLLGVLRPRHAWRWGVAVGMCIPITLYVARVFHLSVAYETRDSTPLEASLALIPAVIGAYAGVAVRAIARRRGPA